MKDIYAKNYIATEKYILNQVRSQQYVFLAESDEDFQLIIPKSEIKTDLKIGDTALISKVYDTYNIKVLKKLTKITLEDINALLEKF